MANSLDEQSSEKLDRLNAYFEKCVEAQPEWLKKCFRDEKVVFGYDRRTGQIGLLTRKMSERLRHKASFLLQRYFVENPAPELFEWMEIDKGLVH